jgi:hypothetical protein
MGRRLGAGASCPKLVLASLRSRCAGEGRGEPGEGWASLSFGTPLEGRKLGADFRFSYLAHPRERTAESLLPK